MLFSQLTRMPLSKQRGQRDHCHVRPDMLDFLRIEQRERESVAADEKDRTRLRCREDIIGKLSRDEIAALIENAVMHEHARSDCDRANQNSMEQAERTEKRREAWPWRSATVTRRINESRRAIASSRD